MSVPAGDLINHLKETEMDNTEITKEQETILKQDNNTVTLEKPITRGNTTITEVNVLRPKNSQAFAGVSITDLVNMDVNALQRVLPRVTEPKLTNHEVKELDPADTFALGVQVAGFFIKKKDLESLSLTE